MELASNQFIGEIKYLTLPVLETELWHFKTLAKTQTICLIRGESARRPSAQSPAERSVCYGILSPSQAKCNHSWRFLWSSSAPDWVEMAIDKAQDMFCLEKSLPCNLFVFWQVCVCVCVREGDQARNPLDFAAVQCPICHSSSAILSPRSHKKTALSVKNNNNKKNISYGIFMSILRHWSVKNLMKTAVWH